MKVIKRYIIVLAVVTVYTSSCRQNAHSHKSPVAPDKIAEVINAMTHIMVRDITNPPLASRFFAYATLAGYEVVSRHNDQFVHMHGIIRDYPQLNGPGLPDSCYRAAAIFAMIDAASHLQPSGHLLDSLKNDFSTYLTEIYYTSEDIRICEQYGQTVSDSIISFASRDGYRNISSYARYTPISGEAYWTPTPPAYLSAVEPHFHTVRTFYGDIVNNYPIIRPVPFNIREDSSFFRMMQAVYSEHLSENREHREIAHFWDCNPFALVDNGHLQTSIKKISPGAHWMSIAGIACDKAAVSFDSTMLIHTVVATAMMDAFITCWNEKYRSNRLRPETAIRKYLDVNWQPLLQTPPFPEYPSGHSVISSCAAEILTSFFGNTFAYADHTEVKYGLPVRNYPSFKAAAEEAAISRFYGGIHFMDAVDNGLIAGRITAEHVLQQIGQANNQ